MATIFNTKIRLRYDSFTAWHDANPILDAGEVAIVRPGDTINGVTPAANCLMKVGDGTSHFNDLAWLSAKAADVHSWAKKSETEFKAWLTSDEGAHLATAQDIANLNSEISTIKGNVKTLQDEVKALQEDTSVSALTGRVETLEGEMDAAEGDIDALETAVGTNDGKGNLFSRIAAVEAKNGEQDSNISTLQGNVNTLMGTAETVGSVAHAVKAEETRATGVEANLQKAIDDEAAARDTAVKAEASARETAITNATNALNSTIAGVKTTAEDAQARVGVVEGVLNGTEGATGLVAKVNTLIGSDADKSVRTIAADEINTIIKGADPEGGKTIENISNLVKYVDENAGEIAELISTVGGHTTKIGTLESDYATLNGTVEGHTTEIGNIKSSIGTVTEGKTLMQLIEENSTADQAKAKELADQALVDAKAYADQAIENVNSAASTLADRVRANEDKLAGIDTTVTAAIATAKQEAIEAAASDAADKAAVVLAEAQADATAKADKALTDAKGYADAKVAPVAADLSTLSGKAITGALNGDKLTMSLNNTVLDLVFVCGGAQ